MLSASAEPFPISLAGEQHRPVGHEPLRPLRLCDVPLLFPATSLDSFVRAAAPPRRCLALEGCSRYLSESDPTGRMLVTRQPLLLF